MGTRTFWRWLHSNVDLLVNAEPFRVDDMVDFVCGIFDHDGNKRSESVFFKEDAGTGNRHEERC